MNILIVEDSKDQLRLLSRVLKQKGFNVFTAENGEEAFSVLCQNKTVQLIISDWIMPKMNGIKLCKKIRNHQFPSYMYFILLTGNTDDDAVIEGMNNGADDFLKKPVDFRELDARLKAGIRVLNLEYKLEEKNKQIKTALRTIETDIKAAASTLYNLIPKINKIQQTHYHWSFRPSSFLGGDMIGYHLLDKNHVSFYQIDVSGHGIPSALFSFSLNQLLRDLNPESSLLFTKDKTENANKPFAKICLPHELMAKLNERFQISSVNMMYFTLVYAVIHLPSGVMKIAHAGHPESLIISADKKITSITGKSLPIGMMLDAVYKTETINLKKGDSVLSYTDGITESENDKGVFYGQQRLMESVKKYASKPAKLFIEQIISDVMEWQNSEIFTDDVSCLKVSWMSQQKEDKNEF